MARLLFILGMDSVDAERPVTPALSPYLNRERSGVMMSGRF